MLDCECRKVAVDVIKQQVAEGSERCSMTTNESFPTGSMAVYKGMKVAVCDVDKTDLTLTRSDLIELINVRILFFYLMSSCAQSYLLVTLIRPLVCFSSTF